jgi:hypothetical protein
MEGTSQKWNKFPDNMAEEFEASKQYQDDFNNTSQEEKNY